MDIHKAYQILQADPNDSDQSIASRYEILHSQHKSKADLAPNEHLREKFNNSLQDLEIAYAKVIRYRNGSDSPDTKQLPITNAHLENKIQNYEKEDGAGVKSLKKELEKLNKNFKYAFFASVFFLATTVYFLLQYKDVNKKYERVMPEFKELKTYKGAFTTGSKLVIRNSDDISLKISYLEVWYLQMEQGKDTVITSKTFEVPLLEPGRSYSPTFTEKNSVKDITNWVFLYMNVQSENKKFGQGIHCSAVPNGEIKLTTN
jgi:hypothetical protein